MLASTLTNLGVVKLNAGEPQAARAYLEEASLLADTLGYPALVISLAENLGLVDVIDADPRSGRRRFLKSLEVGRTTGVKAYVPGAFLGLALAASAEGDHRVAAILHGLADEQYEQAGRPFESPEMQLREIDQGRLRTLMGNATFLLAYQHGRSLGAKREAIKISTQRAAEPATPYAGNTVTAPTDDPAGTGSATGPLSEREREIVALVRRRRPTNRPVALLSVNTVRSHLERIRDKTGARRRAELVRYAMRAGIEAVILPTD